MITTFENTHNMYRTDRAMQVCELPQGVVLPQKQIGFVFVYLRIGANVVVVRKNPKDGRTLVRIPAY